MGRRLSTVLNAPWSGFEERACQRSVFFLDTKMTTDQLHHRLECVGWRAIEEGRQEDGRYCVLAKSCEHYIVAFADTRCAAWSAACSLAMKLTREGRLRLPRL